jgi:hypothetical protein
MPEEVIAARALTRSCGPAKSRPSTHMPRRLWSSPERRWQAQRLGALFRGMLPIALVAACGGLRRGGGGRSIPVDPCSCSQVCSAVAHLLWATGGTPSELVLAIELAKGEGSSASTSDSAQVHWRPTYRRGPVCARPNAPESTRSQVARRPPPRSVCGLDPATSRPRLHLCTSGPAYASRQPRASHQPLALGAYS